MNVRQSAAYLGCAIWCVRNLVWQKLLTPIQIGSSRRLLFDKQDLDQFVEQQKKEAAGRSLYYEFLRRRGPYPTVGQARQYREWFKDVPNSLEVQR